MATEKIEPIVIEDEIPHPQSHKAEVKPATAAALKSQAAKKAPTMDELLAYWTPGREVTMEVPEVMAKHQVKCAVKDCPTMLGYIPVVGEAAPPVLLCEAHWND